MSDEAKEFLIAKGYNPDYGARPLRRAIENLIENPLAEELLRGSFQGKEVVQVLVEGEDEAKRFKFLATTREEAEGQAALVGAGSEATGGSNPGS
jgi:ATP-dependent Clp protease ATP-binding subunit ClpC